MRRQILRFWIYLLLPVFVFISCNQTPQKKGGQEKPLTDSVFVEIEALNSRILSDSTNPENYYDRSLYYIQNKDINKAFSDIGKAIDLDDKNARYFVALSDIYLASGKIPNCLEALKKAEELDEKNNEAFLKLAEVYLILRDYKNTFAYTKKALDLDLVNPVAYFIRGYAYMEQGDTALAIKNYQAAADQDQKYYAAYIELGSLYSTLRNPVATGYLQTAVRIDPNREEAYYLLGMAYQEQGDITKAVETYEKLLVISPDFKDAHYNLGYINLVYINDFASAINYFTRAISLDPKYTDAYFNRGYSYELAGNFANARKDYQKALEVTPNYERAVEGLNRLDSLQP
jgi:tetratricopeptide (TPR) repeat protein